MTPSPARPPLVVEVMVVADAAYGVILQAHQAAVQGRQSDALAILGALAEGVEAHRPILRGALKAEARSAQAGHLTQHSLARFFRPAEKHPDAAGPEQSEIISDFASVLAGHEGRVAKPGRFRVYRDGARVIFEPAGAANDHHPLPEQPGPLVA